jgi:hypothetical protein
MRGMRNAHKILVGKPEGKWSLGRTTHRWENNIKIIFKDINFEDLDWIHLAQVRDQW